MTKRAQKVLQDRRAAAHAFNRMVGLRIQARRQRWNMTQAQLGEKIGFSFAQVSRYESGESPCEVSTLALIADALGCKASDFLDGIKVGDGR